MKPRPEIARRLWASTLAVAALCACGREFDPYSRINSLRVLAIQTEPVAPAPGETSTATPLVYVPAGKAVTYAWDWCPLVGAANDGYPCLLDQAALLGLAAAQGMDLGTVPPLDLGTGPTASLPHTINPALLQALCTGTIPGVPKLTDCKDGFPVQLRVKVRLADGTDEVDAIRTVHLRLDGTAPANLNPSIDGLVATLDAVDTPIDDAGSVILPRLRKTPIKVQVLEAAAQAYVGRDERDQPMNTFERLFISWFVETGDVHRARTSFIVGELPLDGLLRNDWRPDRPEDYPGETARLITVLRDSRGGVSWRSATVRLGAAAQ